MKTSDFFVAASSQKLQENFEKSFGSSVDLDKYTREQLEDMRNKLRTRVFQQESSSKFNDLLTNETYQKDQALLKILNTRIKEMLGENIKQLRDKMVELDEAKKGVRDIKHAKKAKGTKPDFLDMDKDGDKTEPMKKAIKDKQANEGWDDMMKAVKDRSGPKPSGDAGVKKGKAYGGSAQKDVKEPVEKKAKKAKESIAQEGADFGTKYYEQVAQEIFKNRQDIKSQDEVLNYAYKIVSNEQGRRKASYMFNHDEDFPSDVVTAYFALQKSSIAQEGKDEGKPGKNFAKIAKSAGEKYGSKAAGERVAGAVRQKLKKAGKLEESPFKQNVRIVNESLRRMIAEDEEGKAKAITAASDMVNDFTSWMQRVGQYQTKAIIELADAIRADFGLQQAEAFKQAVAPALAATLETLTQQRETISNAVAVLAGEDVPPEEQMGAEPAMGPEEPDMEPAAPDELNPEVGADEFAASDAAAGAGTTGREMRESKFARKLAESHSIIAKLAAK